MMRLYDHPKSGNCYKVRLLLAQLGIPYERVEVDVFDRSRRREILGGKTPIYRIPLLELDDGRRLAESNAILWHLARGTAFLPDDAWERALVLQWLFFEQNQLEASVAVARYWLTIAKTAEENAQALALHQAKGRAAVASMEEHLATSPFFVGGRHTIADIALYAYTHVAEEGGVSLAPAPGVLAWIGRIEAQPGWVPMEG